MTEEEFDLARARRILCLHLPELRQQYGVQSLGLFGSYVRGEKETSWIWW